MDGRMNGKPHIDELHDFLRSRRSVRRFTGEAVPRELLERILETATWAPNAHNRQPWRFVVLSSREAMKKLADAMAEEYRHTLRNEGKSEQEIETIVMRSYERAMGAAVSIVLCMDATVLDEYEDLTRSEGERQMAIQSVAIAGGYLLLAAHAEGLGGVWTCAPLFVPEIVRETLDLPESWEAQGMLLLGYAAETPEARPRRGVRKVTRIV